MKPSLEKILKAAEKTYNVSHYDWELLKLTKAYTAIQIVQAVCLIGTENGYHPKKIAKFLERDRTAVLYHVKKTKELCEVYRDVRESIDKIRRMLSFDYSHTMTGYLARSESGMLTISPVMPTRRAGYWLAEGSKPYPSQSSFPQVTYETEPMAVTITVKFKEDETM